MDGVGGSVERVVHSAIMTRQHMVKHADCSQKVIGINIILVPSTLTENKKPALDALCRSAAAIPGTHQIHYIGYMGIHLLSLINKVFTIKRGTNLTI